MNIERTVQRVISTQLTSFPKSDTIRATFGQSVASVEALLRERNVIIDEPHLEGLTVKLARYFAKRNWNSATMTANLSTLADAIAPKHDVLLDPTLTLKKIVSLHVAHSHEMAATVRRALLANPSIDVPPAVFASSDDGAYNLVECRTQRHLQEETAALGHCVGGTHIGHYRDKMASGDIRIFSLRTAHGVPVATVEYDTKKKAITQIEGKPREISGKEVFFPALCQTLHALRERISVGAINSLPHEDGKILTKDGVFLSSCSFADIPPDDILSGTVAVDDTTPQPVLLALCSSSRLMVDVTRLDLAHLPPRLKCGLTSDAESFHAPHLQAARDIYVNNGTTFHAPQLQTAGEIVANAATTFSVPMLRTARDIYVNNGTTFHAPQLQTAGEIVANAATTFSVPLLQTAGSIFADAATTFSTPLLQTAGGIIARTATSFSAPQLQTAGNIDIRKATTFHAPMLQAAGYIVVCAATAFSAPLLRTAGDIIASEATAFSAPLLRTAGSIHAKAATAFSAPLLQESGVIDANAATTFDAPLLQRSGSIYAPGYTDTQSLPSPGM